MDDAPTEHTVPRPGGQRPAPSEQRRAARLTDRDRDLLAFAAEHRLLLREQVQALLGISASAAGRRLYALTEAGVLARSQPFDGRPAWFRITRAGLHAIASELAPPRADLGAFRHDIGLAWLHLAALAGAFGRCADVVTERRMRSHDAILDAGAETILHRGAETSLDGGAERFGIRLGGVGPRGRDRLHYPDLLLVDAGGRRIAVELELSRKSRARRESIFFGYASERRIDAVLYLVESPAMAASIRSTAAAFGISDRVHVQYVRWAGAARNDGGGRAPARTRRGQRNAAQGAPASRNSGERSRVQRDPRRETSR
jgi:hypothetical protein